MTTHTTGKNRSVSGEREIIFATIEKHLPSSMTQAVVKMLTDRIMEALRTAAPTAPSTAAGERDTEALAEFLNSECEFADGLTGTSWPQHSHDDGYRGGGGYVRLAPPDVVARRREDAKAILSFLSQRRTAAPTAPSTAAGEMAFVCGCGWDGSYADLNETVEGMTCPKCRLGRNLDCAAALATPPAQGVEEETETLENLIGAAIGARTAPPWQEQAAQWHEEQARIADADTITHQTESAIEYCRQFHRYHTELAANYRALIPNGRKDE